MLCRTISPDPDVWLISRLLSLFDWERLHRQSPTYRVVGGLYLSEIRLVLSDHVLMTPHYPVGSGCCPLLVKTPPVGPPVWWSDNKNVLSNCDYGTQYMYIKTGYYLSYLPEQALVPGTPIVIKTKGIGKPLYTCCLTSIGKSSLALDRVTLALFDRSKKYLWDTEQSCVFTSAP